MLQDNDLSYKKKMKAEESKHIQGQAIFAVSNTCYVVMEPMSQKNGCRKPESA